MCAKALRQHGIQSPRELFSMGIKKEAGTEWFWTGGHGKWMYHDEHDTMTF